MKIKEIHIFDVDGTLVNSIHRYRTIEGKIDLPYWIDNEHKTLKDTVLPLAEKFRAICQESDKYAIIATARIWCTLSKKFAIINNLIPNGLVARRDRNDSRGGAELKIAYVNKLLNLKQFAQVKVIHIYEDNYKYLTDIMAEYRQRGFAVVGHYIPSKQGH